MRYDREHQRPTDPEYNAAEIGALAHLYRGEMYRAPSGEPGWTPPRTGPSSPPASRLSVTFSSVQATPLPIVLVSFLLAAFLLFEARRYLYFDIWNTRLRVIGVVLLRSDPADAGEPAPTTPGTKLLADDLKRLRLHIGLLDAVGLRLRRNYGWIFAIQIASYWSKIGVHPTPLASSATYGKERRSALCPGRSS